MPGPWRRRTDSAGRGGPGVARAAAAAERRRAASGPRLVEALEARTLLSASAVASAAVPSADEFPVHLATDSPGSGPAVAAGADGSFVVTWQAPDADQSGIYARRFDAAGNALAAEFPVNTTTASVQSKPAVTVVAGGGVVVAWQSDGQDGSGYGVYARRFGPNGADADGAGAGGEFVLNTMTDDGQSTPAVAATPGGGFVAAWMDRVHDTEGPGIYARRFDAAGVALDAAEFRINQVASGYQTGPALGVDAAGNFVVAWQSMDGAGEYHVVARRFGADGVARGDDVEVTTAASPTLVLPEPSIAVAGDGSFVVSWQALGPGGTGFLAYARRFDAAANALGAPFAVGAGAADQDVFPAVAVQPEGGFLVTWQEDRHDGSGLDVYARRFDAGGAADGAEFVVNTTRPGAQSAPAAATSDSGRSILVWQSAEAPGDGGGIDARTFTTAAANDPPQAGTIAPVSVQEDAPDATVSLFDAFSDSTDADADLTYAVTANTSPSLFRSTAIDPATGVLTLAFAPDASGGADVTVRATDTGGLSAETTFHVTVSAVNDAPVNAVPAAQQTPAGTPLVFAAVHHNRVGVDDVDAGEGPIRVTLGSTGGTLTLATTAGLSFTAGDGAGDASMTFAGSPAAVNTALDGLRFDPSPGFSGAASVSIQSDDQGNSGAGGAKTDSDTVAITVTDQLPPPLISISGASVTEPDAGATADAVFTVSLSEARPYAVTVQYATQNGAAGVAGTAVAPADYVASSGTLTFAPGETSKTVAVAVAGDALDEVDEGFSVVLSNPTGGTIQVASAAGRIVDNDPPPAMSIGDVAVPEGTAPGAESVLNFPVTLSAPSGQRIQVVYQLGGGGNDTATRRVDYDGSSGILVFEPGQTSQVISFPVVGDALDEPDETLSILLGFRDVDNAYTFADGQAVGTIVDDDATPTLAIGDVTVVEGSSPDGTLAELLVRLSAPSGQTVTAFFNTGDDTATAAGGDYVTAGGLLTFAPAETTKTIQVRVSGDLLDEPDESFNVFLAAPQHATFADSRGIVHVRDDDAPPAASADDLAVAEGDSEAGRLVGVTFRLSSASGRTVSLNYATADGTAQAGADYDAASGTVTFAPGEVTKTVDLRVLGDRSPEADETFFVRLVDAAEATVADAEAVVTIRNDDLVQVSVGDAGRVTEGNAGTTRAVFIVSLTGPSASPVSVDYATADGTALAGSDYDAASGTLVFQPGEITKTIVVAVRGDTAFEPDETFRLVLSAPPGAVLLDGDASATIANDDASAPAPRVAEVFVSSTAWNAAFKDRLAALGLGSARFGYSVPAGAGQLATLPWDNVNQVVVRFDSDVSVSRDDLAVRGVAVPAYGLTDFAYDPATRTATWTLDRPLRGDKVLLDLDGDAGGASGPTGPGGEAGAALDGEWTNGTAGGGAAAFPSGDGAPGGDFEFRLNALSGDADRSARVTAVDLFRVRQRLFTSAARPGTGTYRYDVFHDLNGDGRIDARDLLVVRRSSFQSLPATEPSGADPAAPATRALLFGDAPVLP